MSLIDDIRRMDRPDFFEGGNDKQRVKLNKVVKMLRDLKDSADQNAPNAGGGEIPSLQRVIILQNGARVAVQIPMNILAE